MQRVVTVQGESAVAQQLLGISAGVSSGAMEVDAHGPTPPTSELVHTGAVEVAAEEGHAAASAQGASRDFASAEVQL